MTYLYIGESWIGYRYLEVEVLNQQVRDDTESVLIEFPAVHKHYQLHSGTGLGHKNRCWWVDPQYVMVIEGRYALIYRGDEFSEIKGAKVSVIPESRDPYNNYVEVEWAGAGTFRVPISSLEVDI